MTTTSTLSMNDEPTTIPVLTHVVPSDDIFPGTLAALHDRLAERASFFALANALKESMRPEMERVVDDVVQRTLKAAWAHKAGASNVLDTSA